MEKPNDFEKFHDFLVFWSGNSKIRIIWANIEAVRWIGAKRK
jgi:hypothetical protein